MINKITPNIQNNNYTNNAKILKYNPIQTRSSQLISKSFAPTFTSIGQIGITNFSKASENLYRGAQPTFKQIKMLAKNGIKTIINLRSGGSKQDHIKEKLAKLLFGIKFEHIPMNLYVQPSRKQVEKFLQIVDNTEGKIFVHCFQGQDRTGFMCAIYKIARENWPVENAIKEMKNFGHEEISHPEFIKFLKKQAESFRKSSNIEQQGEFSLLKTTSLIKQQSESSIPKITSSYATIN
ncbi:MAG: dual specificity protein phosphatase family protein [Candidatus Gastranaerophilales bacterium]|nr:dual specificity protein phosphatase family protein [Candidatus Gastranaerophilales bacterium]